MSSVFINEVSYDHVLKRHFVEILTPGGFHAGGWSVHYYDSNGFHFAIGSFGGGSGSATGKAAFKTSATSMSVTGAVALVAPDWLDPQTPRIVEFLSFGGGLTAQNGLAAGLSSSDIGDFTSPLLQNGRTFQRSGMGDMAEDFAWRVARKTEGTANSGQSYLVEDLALNGHTILADTLIGHAGDDTVSGRGGDDWLAGEFGNDTILGGGGNDTAFGGQGDDLLRGGGGADHLDGGRGNDTLNGEAGRDVLFGRQGNDALYGSFGNDGLMDGGLGSDSLWGGAGNDTMEGGGGADFLYGGSGADLLGGGSGDDSLFGEQGRDDLSGGQGNDVLMGGESLDTLSGGSGDDTLDGGVRADWLTGGDGADRLLGGEGDDTLAGDADADMLSGGSGNDTLAGGRGNDTLDGGEGDDHLIFAQNGGWDMTTGGAGADVFQFSGAFGMCTITDFEQGTDSLVLIGIPTATSLTDLTVIHTPAGQTHVTIAGHGTLVLSDAAIRLTEADFIFV